MAWVPLPWWASKSRIATRSQPSACRACAAATAALLKTQNPIARAGSAWWPGGRPQLNAATPASPATASTAAIAPPAARSAASQLASVTIVSGSSAPPPPAQNRSISST